MYIDRVHQRNNENVVTEGLADSIHIQPQLSKCALIGFQTCYKDAFFSYIYFVVNIFSSYIRTWIILILGRFWSTQAFYFITPV